MIFFEFLFLLISLLLLIFSITISVYKSFSSPIREIHLITLTSVSFLLNTLFFLISASLHEPNMINPLGEQFHKVGQIFAYFGLALLTLIMILPNFKANYKYLSALTFIIVIYTSTAIINYFTVFQEVGKDFIHIKNTFIGSFLTTIGLILLIYVIVGRYQQLKRMFSKNSNKITKTRHFLFFVILLSIIVVFFVLARFNLEIFPAYGYFLPVSASIFYFTLFFINKTELLFLTPIKLQRIIIIHKQSGLELYNINYSNEYSNDDFFSEIFTGATTSLKKILEAKGSLGFIKYFDRVIQPAEENNIIAYIIVSDSNIITSSIAKWLARKFHDEFGSEIRNFGKKLVDKSDYASFEKYVIKARKFIPF